MANTCTNLEGGTVPLVLVGDGHGSKNYPKLGRISVTWQIWDAVLVLAEPCDVVQVPSRSVAWQAQVVARAPLRDGRVLDPDDAAAVLVLEARRDERGRCWLRVRLPSRPNTASGWVNAQRVRIRRTPWRIEVDRARRSVALLREGRVAMRVRGVIGTAGTPTPRGLFAVTDAVRGSPDAFLGSWVLPLTAHSDVLDTYDGGDGRVALHGRGADSLQAPLGTAASHGCVRLANADIARIVRRVGTRAISGTPVRIR